FSWEIARGTCVCVVTFTTLHVLTTTGNSRRPPVGTLGSELIFPRVVIQWQKCFIKFVKVCESSSCTAPIYLRYVVEFVTICEYSEIAEKIWKIIPAEKLLT